MQGRIPAGERSGRGNGHAALGLSLAVLLTLPSQLAALPFHSGERLRMTVRLLRIPVGELESEVKDRIESETHVRTVSTKATSTGLFGLVYRIRDTMTTHFDAEHGTTLGSEIIENYNDFHNRETITLHGATALVHREFKGTVRERQETVVPGSRDLLAAVFALRSESLKTEGELHIPIFSGVKQWELVAQVVGRERVTVEAGTFQAIRVRGHTTFGGKLRTDGDIIMWLSDDERRLPLRVSAPLVVGSIDTELTSFEWTSERSDPGPPPIPVAGSH